MRLRIGSIRAESSRFGPVSAVSAGIAETADSGRNSKKKKGAKQTVWTKS